MDFAKKNAWNFVNGHGKPQQSSVAREVWGGFVSVPILTFGLVAFMFALAALQPASGQILESCEHSGLLECVGDVGQEVEYILHQAGDISREIGESAEATARSAETAQASFGRQKVCITPGLNIGPQYSMVFRIPGRKLTVVKPDGSKQKARSVRLDNFQTVNTIFRVKRFASFMQSYIVVKIFRNGKPYDMLKERIRDRYSREKLVDESCSAYFVEAQDRQRDLRLHNGMHNGN